VTSPPPLRHPFFWLSRSFRAVAALILFVLVVRLAWGDYASRALRAQSEHLLATGQPLKAEDVVYPPVPDAENAWLAIVKAMQARAAVDSPRYSNDEYNDYPPYPAYWLKRAEASEHANTAAFALVRKARALKKSQPRSQLISPVANSMLPSINTARALANMLADGATYAHVTGDDTDALERLMDLWHVAAALREDDLLVSQLVANGLEALAVDAAEVIAPGLRFRATLGIRPASREQVRQFVKLLLDEDRAWDRMRAAILTERLAAAEFAETSAKGTWVIHPLAEMDQVRGNRYYQAAYDATEARDKPTIEASLAHRQPPDRAAPTSQPVVPRYSRWFKGFPNDLSRYFETHLRVLAERRVAAISLAIQLYRADHGGAWPGRLEELVPQYLPAVPVDPFLGDGRTVGYVAGKRPMVYFEAGRGAAELPPPEPTYGYYASQSRGHPVVRQYRDLSRWAPPPPSTQAVKDQAKKADAPGK
jgi:hypothetical protein